jgi:hypothetical protein
LLEEFLVIDATFQVVRFAVQSGVARIGGIELLAPVGVEPPVLGVVQGHEEPQPLPADRLLEAADHVGPGAHPDGIPVTEPGVPHGEAVVVFTDRAGELCARLPEQLCPFIRIEPFALEHRDEILPSELLGSAIGADVVFPLGGALDVHVVGVPGPVRSPGWHAVHTPMGVNAELGIPKPLRCGMLHE